MNKDAKIASLFGVFNNATDIVDKISFLDLILGKDVVVQSRELSIKHIFRCASRYHSCSRANAGEFWRPNEKQALYRI